MIAAVVKIRGCDTPAVFLTPDQARAIARLKQRATVAEIKQEVARSYKIDPQKLVDADRRREYAWPRQVAIYLAREITHKSYPWIAHSFGMTDHTSALYAHREVAREIAAGKGERGAKAVEIRERLHA